MERSGGHEFDPSSGQIAEPESVVQLGTLMSNGKSNTALHLVIYFLNILPNRIALELCGPHSGHRSPVRYYTTLYMCAKNAPDLPWRPPFQKPQPAP